MKRLLTVIVFLFLCSGGRVSAQTSMNAASEPQLPAQAERPLSPGQTVVAGGSPQNPFFGSVPSGQAQPGVLPLSFKEAVDRALKYNLGLLIAQQGTREAQGARWRELSNLLPDLSTLTSETRQQLNLKAFGFSGIPGVPTIVGPFNVFDTRVFLSQPILDLRAIHRARAETENLKAAQYSYRDARELVVLVAADLYLQALAGASRVEAARAELKTAQALFDRAVDLEKSGVAAGIDVLRSQVEWQAQQQRLIFFQNEFQKQKLNLARAIGLPIRQEFNLTDQIPYAPGPSLTPEEALERAYQSRADYQRALTLVRAAESAKKAARGEAFPSLRFDGNYGDIGTAPAASHGTFAVAASLRIPIFQGGRVHGNVLQADALLQQRRSELEDLRSRMEYEVRTAFLDLEAAGEQVQVAKSAMHLAGEQMKQAQDRFAAGVVSSIEVVQAQEALATADENHISSLYRHNVAKASLARAMGLAEAAYQQFLGGNR